MKRSTNGSTRQFTVNTGLKQYSYRSLGATPDRIRLLRLHPSEDPTSQIQCTLFQTNLNEAPPYVAVSYAWGDKSRKQTIIVDGEYLNVTLSLKNALERLRSSNEELLLWADAACINQDDIPERNIQTANMRVIYQNAESVAVWLGKQYNGSGKAIALAHDLNGADSFESVHEIVTKPERKDEFRALVRLFRRQYWWRIWVIQEVSCGKRSTVYCGSDEVSWEELDNVCGILKSHEQSLESIFYNRLSYARTLTSGGPRGLQLSRFSPFTTAPPLLELLISHKSKHSTDPKDKVYALVGISSSRETFGKIDYSRPLSEILTHTAQHIITTTKKLDIICVKQNDNITEGLPSWAPDWTRPHSSTGAILIGLHHHEPSFKASGDTSADVRFITDTSTNERMLQVSGFVIDTIKTIGMPFTRRGSPADATPALHVFHDWWNTFVAEHSSSPTSQAIFARTISCGNWMFEDESIYEAKLEAIFSLSDGLLSDSDVLRMDPPSRTSTLSRTGTMSDSVQSLGEYEDEEVDDDVEEKEKYGAILSAAMMMNRRRLMLSTNGLVALGPWAAANGDLICILLGCKYPVVLRRIGERYTLIGEAYVDGYMDGQGIQGLKTSEFTLDSFKIY